MVDISVETDRPRSGISSASLRPGRALCKGRVLALVAGATALLILGACRTEGRPPTAPLDVVADADADAGARDGGRGRPTAGRFDDQSDLCFGILTAAEDDDLARRACARPLPTDEDEGVIALPCTNEGLAEATLDERRLEGPVIRVGPKRRYVDLRLTRAVERDDGCRWEVHETLVGQVAEDDVVAPGAMTWTHVERRLEGVGCQRACEVTTTMSFAPAPDASNLRR